MGKFPHTGNMPQFQEAFKVMFLSRAINIYTQRLHFTQQNTQPLKRTESNHKGDSIHEHFSTSFKNLKIFNFIFSDNESESA